MAYRLKRYAPPGLCEVVNRAGEKQLWTKYGRRTAGITRCAMCSRMVDSAAPGVYAPAEPTFANQHERICADCVEH